MLRQIALATALLLLSAALAARGAALLHPGAPVFIEVDITEKQIELRLSGEMDVILPNWLGIDSKPYWEEISEAAKAAVLEKARPFLAKNCEVRIGGKGLAFTSFEIDFPENLKELFREPGLLMTARYPIERIPRSIHFRWHEFDNLPALYAEPEIPAATRVRDASTSDFVQIEYARFTKEEPEHIWNAKELVRRARPEIQAPPPPAPPVIPVPLLSLGLGLLGLGFAAFGRRTGRARWPLALALLVGAGVSYRVAVLELPSPFAPEIRAPQGEEAEKLFETLHANLYMAFRGNTEEEIYELLAASVTPELIDEFYNSIFESLVMRGEGGAICEIERLEQLDGRTQDSTPGDKAFEVDWKWRVYGEVSHWGHQHRRINQYHALYEVAYVNQAWRISDVEILSQERVDQ
jgi:hypothetical protein